MQWAKGRPLSCKPRNPLLAPFPEVPGLFVSPTKLLFFVISGKFYGFLSAGKAVCLILGMSEWLMFWCDIVSEGKGWYSQVWDHTTLLIFRASWADLLRNPQEPRSKCQMKITFIFFGNISEIIRWLPLITLIFTELDYTICVWKMPWIESVPFESVHQNVSCNEDKVSIYSI